MQAFPPMYTASIGCLGIAPGHRDTGKRIVNESRSSIRRNSAGSGSPSFSTRRRRYHSASRSDRGSAGGFVTGRSLRLRVLHGTTVRLVLLDLRLLAGEHGVEGQRDEVLRLLDLVGLRVRLVVDAAAVRDVAGLVDHEHVGRRLRLVRLPDGAVRV